MQDEIHSSIEGIQLIPEGFPEYGSIQHPFAEAQLSDAQFVHPSAVVVPLSAVIQSFVVECEHLSVELQYLSVEFEHLSVGVAHWP